jgi:hydroxymethylglutaryl-CoA reductase
MMNGIDPVLIATGNDWRAVESGAHAWAAEVLSPGVELYTTSLS